MTKQARKLNKFGQYLFDHNYSVRYAERKIGISYPTLIKVKFSRYDLCDPRTLANCAVFCECSVEELTADAPLKRNEDSAFDQALERMSKKHGIPIRIKEVHEGTGVAKTIFTKLRKGDASSCEDRTLKDIADFLEITPDELRNNKLLPEHIESRKPTKNKKA